MEGNLELKWRHRRAIGLMAGAVMFFSTNALFVKLTLGDNHPFLYNAAVWLGMALGLAAVLALSHRPVFADPTARKVLFRRVAGLRTGGVRRWDLVGMLVLMVIGRFAFAFFGWATQYVETATVSILHYTWPVIFVLGISRWDRTNQGRYRRVTAFSWTGLALAFLGMAAVVTGTLGFDAIHAGLGSIFGMALALASAVLVAFTIAFGYPLGVEIASEVADRTGVNMDQRHLELSCLLFGYLVSAVVSIIPNVLIGLGAGGRITLASLGWAMAVGVSFVPGAVLARKAVLITPDLAVNALIYASPVVGLVWLGLFTEIIVARFDLLVLGTLVVAAANVLLNRPRGRVHRMS